MSKYSSFATHFVTHSRTHIYFDYTHCRFISLSDPEPRDAYAELEEVLDYLFYYPSHPPFLATRIIQRFGISNPSPGFVERVATSYITGSFGQFGSGKYGDLGAMLATILLDNESRAVVLDADQTHGHLREPLIKVLSFFRSMGLQCEYRLLRLCNCIIISHRLYFSLMMNFILPSSSTYQMKCLRA